MRMNYKDRSILRKLMIPLIMLLFLQSAVMLYVLTVSGVFSQSRKNELNILSERANTRAQSLQNDMVKNWASLEFWQKNINETVAEVMDRHRAEIGDTSFDCELNADIAYAATPILIDILRKNGTTGVFLTINGPATVAQKNSNAGVYIRSVDPSFHAIDNSDLLLECGLPRISRDFGIALDTFWRAAFTLKSGDVNHDNDFFYNPMKASNQKDDYNVTDYGYWSPVVSPGGNGDISVITYSVPLKYTDGSVWGVVGVEISLQYLASMLTYGELAAGGTGSYFLGITEDGENYKTVISNGPKFKAYFHDDTPLTISRKFDENIVILKSDRLDHECEIYGSKKNLRLYNENTPFENQIWTLFAIRDSCEMFAYSENLKFNIALSMSATFIIGLVVVMLISQDVISPIKKLVGELGKAEIDNKSNLRAAIKLDDSHITEIDTLKHSIEQLSHTVAQTAYRSTQILGMAGIPLGVFEYRPDLKNYFISRQMISLLKWDVGNNDTEDYGVFVSCDFLESRLSELLANVYDAENHIYWITLGNVTHWIKLTYQTDSEFGGMSGAIIDVTDTVESQKRIIYERDYDLLTSLMNRRAFEAECQKVFVSSECSGSSESCSPNNSENDGGQMLSAGICALIMFDLDNLKFLNDTYGHDCGDIYIRAFAGELKRFMSYGTDGRGDLEKGNKYVDDVTYIGEKSDNAVIARRSGDEFYVLLHGFSSKEIVRRIIDEVWKNILSTVITLPDGSQFKLRASGGIAWYPFDSVDYTQLIRYADFAMYRIKHTTKGTLKDFDRKIYGTDAILINGQAALNRLIDENLLMYAVQPIVSAYDGSVYGYEFLMRPQVEGLNSPLDVLRLAKAQSKLYHIERMTWEGALSAFVRMRKSGQILPGEKCFINTIPNQTISNEDEKRFDLLYSDTLCDVVLEFTESEQNNDMYTSRKLNYIRRHGGITALDDYGSGYNSERALVYFNSDIVKIDISLVSGVDTDTSKQQLIQNLINYCSEKGIMVLAEGVETDGEMKMLSSLGVSFMQGYYIAKPSYQTAPIDPNIVGKIKQYRAERGK